MHSAAYAYVAGEVAHMKLPPGPVLEIGSRDINGTVRHLFQGRSYTGIDSSPGPGVDVVANGDTYAPDVPQAVVVCTEVLEHAANAEAVCWQAYRVLRPGGVFILTAAGVGRVPHSAVDGGPIRADEFYENVTETDLRVWLTPFAEVHVQLNAFAHDIYATAVKA